MSEVLLNIMRKTRYIIKNGRQLLFPSLISNLSVNLHSQNKHKDLVQNGIYEKTKITPSHTNLDYEYYIGC